MRHPTNSRILRCIGQDLEARGIKAFDIRNEGTHFVVRAGCEGPPAPMPVIVQYSMDDIEQLDYAGKNKRGKSSPPKEFVNLAQILRVIGGYVDKNKALFLRVSNAEARGTDPVIKVEYRTADGERIVGYHEGSAIYDMCVRMYKRRGRVAGGGKGQGIWRR